MPKLKGIQFEAAIIERYRGRACSVEEALIEMYLAGVSVRRIEDITEALLEPKYRLAQLATLTRKLMSTSKYGKSETNQRLSLCLSRWYLLETQLGRRSSKRFYA